MQRLAKSTLPLKQTERKRSKMATKRQRKYQDSPAWLKEAMAEEQFLENLRETPKEKKGHRLLLHTIFPERFDERGVAIPKRI